MAPRGGREHRRPWRHPVQEAALSEVSASFLRIRHPEAMEKGISSARLDPDCGERFLRLRSSLGVTTFGLNQLVLEPGQRSRIHRHARQEEVYIVLEGTLTLEVEAEPHDYGLGELIRVGPEVRRRLVNRGPGRLVLLALGGALEHDGRDGEAFAAWEQSTPASPRDVPFPEDLDASQLRG
jgi:quercetin dioxygenase-like cupin family protein